MRTFTPKSTWSSKRSNKSLCCLSGGHFSIFRTNWRTVTVLLFVAVAHVAKALIKVIFLSLSSPLLSCLTIPTDPACCVLLLLQYRLKRLTLCFVFCLNEILRPYQFLMIRYTEKEKCLNVSSEQRWHRSDCASPQSDLGLHCSLK